MFNHPVTLGLIKIIRSAWPAFLYIVVGLAIIRRSEKLEDKRLEEVIKRKATKGAHKSSSNF